MDHFKNYSEWLQSNEDKSSYQIIVSYDITYPDFRKQVLAHLESRYSCKMINESTYRLVRTLTKDQIKTLVDDLKVMYLMHKDRIVENLTEQKVISIQLIIPDGRQFHFEEVINEVVSK